MKKFLRHIESGFTIIELLIVMAVLGVLGTGLIVALNPQQQIAKANDSRRKSELRYITNLLNLYYNDNGKFPPPKAGTCDYDNGSGSGNCFVLSTATNTPGNVWIPALSTYTKSALPVDPINTGDPRNTGTYAYAYGDVSADGQHYDLITQLQNTGDPDRCELKAYQYEFGFTGGPLNWCTGGATNSKYIFQLNHE